MIELPGTALGVLQGLLSGHGPADIARKITVPALGVEIPTSWRLVDTRHGVTYSWFDNPDDVYDPFRIFEGTTSAGTVQLAVGDCDRTRVRGEERKYKITHFVFPTGSFRPIAEFLATDDYADKREMIAIIKGKNDSAKFYDPTDNLPTEYAGFRIETYRDRINRPGSYNKLGIVAHEGDLETMLAHTLIQSQSRFGLGPI